MISLLNKTRFLADVGLKNGVGMLCDLSGRWWGGAADAEETGSFRDGEIISGLVGR